MAGMLATPVVLLGRSPGVWLQLLAGHRCAVPRAALVHASAAAAKTVPIYFSYLREQGRLSWWLWVTWDACRKSWNAASLGTWVQVHGERQFPVSCQFRD